MALPTHADVEIILDSLRRATTREQLMARAHTWRDTVEYLKTSPTMNVRATHIRNLIKHRLVMDFGR